MSLIITIFIDTINMGCMPLNIFQLPSLQFLSVSFNSDLAGYLPQFHETSPLRQLVLANTRFIITIFIDTINMGCMPLNIFQLPSLQFLSVSFNSDLAGYLPQFHETSPLRQLVLANTRFSRELPTSIERLDS